MIRLTVRHQSQPGAEEVHEFDKPVITMGRHSENEVVLGERTVSRKHAQIEFDGTRYVLKDLGSHFGVFVNKKKIDAEELAPGSEIYITPFIIRFDVISGVPASAGDPDLTLGPDVGALQRAPQAPLPPAPEPEPALEDNLVDLPPEPLPDDHISNLPGLDAPPPEFVPAAEPESFGGGEPQGEEEGGTLMSWDGHGDQAAEPAAQSPPAFEIDESPPPPPPAPVLKKPVLSDETPSEPEEFKPWDNASKAQEEEEDVLEPAEPAPLSRRRESGPLPVDEKARKSDLLWCRGFGRVRALLIGFMLLVLPFFPLAAERGKVFFFWDLFSLENTGPLVAMYIGAAALGLFLLLFSISSSGLARGFLQALFSGAYLGVVFGVLAGGKVPLGAGAVDVGADLGRILFVVLFCGLILAAVTARIKLYHPRKLFPRLFGFLAAAAILAALFVPSSLLGQEGDSWFTFVLQALKAPEKPWFTLVHLGLAALVALVALTNVLPWRSGFRSRIALLAVFYLMLSPLVTSLSAQIPRVEGSNVIALVGSSRDFLLVFLAAWALLVGVSAFLGNFLVSMNYNEKMLLADK